MNIIYAYIVRNAEFEQRYSLRHVELDDLLRQADFVSVHVPLTADTKHLLDAGKLALMKPTACLINTSRGDVVDNQALQEALQSGKLARAALDVYENEPAATDPSFGAPIAKVDNLYGTHHIAASTEQAQLAVAEEAVRIVENFLKSETVINCVN